MGTSAPHTFITPGVYMDWLMVMVHPCMSAERKRGWILGGEPDATQSPVLLQGHQVLPMRLSCSQAWKTFHSWLSKAALTYQ